MKRRAGIVIMGALLALTLWSLTAYSADDDDKKAIKEAQEAVKKLVESMNGEKGDVKGQVKAIQAKFPDLKNVMWVYKPRSKGGIGMKDGASIETDLAKLGSNNSKIKLTPKKIADIKDDLIKAGEISRAIAEITEHYAPKKGADEWQKYTKEMKKGAVDLIAAAKGGNAASIKKAAGNLSGSCTDCHAKFRND